MQTYSFLDVQASINGPGGNFSLGSGSGNADEGITVEAAEELNGMTIGADGEGMHTLRANRSGKVTIRLLKTSPVNGQLSALLAYQRSSSARWGQNNLQITNPVTGDDFTCEQVAFNKVPTVTWAKDANFNEWNFDAIKVDPRLGSGVPDVNV